MELLSFPIPGTDYKALCETTLFFLDLCPRKFYNEKCQKHGAAGLRIRGDRAGAQGTAGSAFMLWQCAVRRGYV